MFSQALSNLPNADKTLARVMDDFAFYNMAYHVLTQGKGSLTRILILQRLVFQPANANKLARSLDLDYKTVKHHLRVLEESKFISPWKQGTYGSIYCATEYFRSHGFLLKARWTSIRSEKRLSAGWKKKLAEEEDLKPLVSVAPTKGNDFKLSPLSE